MNLFFWLLVAMALVVLWFCLAFLFRPIGKLFSRLWEDALEEMEMNKEDEEKEK